MNRKFKELQDVAIKEGRLRLSPDQYKSAKNDMFGGNGFSKADSFLGKKMTAAAISRPTSVVETLGKVPEGFGEFKTWASEDVKIAVVAFLNPADFSGIMIRGVTKFDTIEFVSATGLASFSEDIENEGVASFVGIVAAGAEITAGIFGAPEVIPLIEAGEKFAKEQFKEEKVKTKRRDVFGEDPGSGHKARQEGGVAVSMPFGTTSTFVSGDDDLEEERWIKKPGDRNHKSIPEHMKGQRAFFLKRGTNKEMAKEDGSIIIYPWDWKFEDNFGFYRLEVILERHDSTPPEFEKDPGPIVE